MSLIALHERTQIATWLEREPWIQIYALGDLDEFFWPRTTWYGWWEGDGLQAVTLLYNSSPVPTLLAVTSAHRDPMERLLLELRRLLPARVYCHLSPGFSTALTRPHTPTSTAATDDPPAQAQRYVLTPHGVHLKMGLRHPQQVRTVATAGVVRISRNDLDELMQLYAESYRENWFDPRMLDTGCYFGMRRNDQLVSVAGVHVYSPVYRVAALGNIATHPDYRGRGYAQTVTAAVCQHLVRAVDHVALNVHCENEVAIRCYERLGFEKVGEYEEYLATLV